LITYTNPARTQTNNRHATSTAASPAAANACYERPTSSTDAWRRIKSWRNIKASTGQGMALFVANDAGD